MSFATPSVNGFLSPYFTFKLNDSPFLTPTWTVAWLLVGSIVAYNLLFAGGESYEGIPSIVGEDPFSSFKAAWRVARHGRDMLSKGYEMYKAGAFKSGAFRVSQYDRWHVIISGKKNIDEIAKAPEDVFSFTAAAEDRVFGKLLLGPTINSNLYHSDIVRITLTRAIASMFQDLKEEIIQGFKDNIPLTDEWTSIVPFPRITQVVARASSRAFVGLPLCRNPEYINLSVKFTADFCAGRALLTKLPVFLRRIVAPTQHHVPKSVDATLKLLGPIIEERQKKIDEHGFDYPDKPNDFLSFLMDAAEGEERTPRLLTNRMLVLSLSAIHTSSLSFTHALLDLAAHPEYIVPMREEVEAVVDSDGWTKVSLTKMHKVDSFLKESQRFNGLGSTALTRRALKDYKLSNGTLISKGATISVPLYAIHRDEDIYPNPEVFDGFRFSKIREQEGQSTTNQFVSTNPNYMPFGHAKHACPGRFFAANELKLMLAYLVLNYDVKMENEGVRPPNKWAGFECSPDRSAPVMIRGRRD